MRASRPYSRTMPADPKSLVSRELSEQFREILSKYPRVAIAGGPNTGKSTLASFATDREVISTDDWLPEAPGRPAGKRWNPALDLSWSAISADVIRVCHELHSFVVEGTRVAHALRKGLDVGAVIVLSEPRLPLTPGQESQRKAIETVLRDWLSNAGKRPALFQFTGA